MNDRITFIIKALANSKSVTPTFSTDTFNGDMVITITIQKPNADTVSLEPNLVTQKYEIPVSLMKIGTHKIWVKINGFTKTSVSYIINQ